MIGNIIYGGEILLEEFKEYLTLQGKVKVLSIVTVYTLKVITNGIWSPLAENVRCCTGKTS